MVKITYIITGAVLIVALVAIGAFVYYHGSAPTAPAPTPWPAPGLTNGTEAGITAFQALSLGNNDASVKRWMANNKNASIAEISSEFCDGGLSDTWKLTYASDSEEATVKIGNMTVQDVTFAKTPERVFPRQQLITDKLIDSDRACGIASNSLANIGDATDGPASITLTMKGSGTPIWDINYPIASGYYIFRIDASGGKITESVQVNGS
ncbi:MAG TPA: hypothetical protein VMC84_11680 [Methanocella sp.]|uniref:hypothetical protein n=1 Tax=Methanocella sp. TaxID=2052833 RepID=UPI002BEF3469|nr:hypothetical protein [Methanocella sp.]HTY91828.1 hypothetical protein [Methanocella sp.]